MNIKRGEIYFIKSAPRTGSEQSGDRPAVIVSNDASNATAPVVEVVWLTSAAKKWLPTHCRVRCRIPSIALCEQVTTVSKTRLTERVRRCSRHEMAKINKCLKVSLGLVK